MMENGVVSNVILGEKITVNKGKNVLLLVFEANVYENEKIVH